MMDRSSILRQVSLLGLLAVIAFAISGTAAVPASAATRLDLLPTPALPADGSAQNTGIVDLSRGAGGRVLGVLAGQSPTAGYFGVVALNQGGALESSFGEGGFTTPLKLPFGGFDNLSPQGEAAASGGDGRVVVVGYSQEGKREPTAFSPLVARYLEDGTLDRSFAGDGILGRAPQGRGGTQFHDVAVARDGTILVVGGRDEAGEGVSAPAGVIYALRPDGNRDKAFGEGGRVILKGRHGDLYSTLRGIQLLPSGKILVVGYLDSRLLLARLDQHGALDRTFGDGDGKVTLDLHSLACCEGAELGLAPGGRIVVAGMGGSPSKYRVFLARYLRSGRLDRHFGNEGVEASPRKRRLTALFGLAVERSGKIVTVGRAEGTGGNPGYSFAAFRNLAGGPADRGFGSGGLSVLQPGSEGIAGAALSLSKGALVGGSYLDRLSDPAVPTTKLLLGRIDAPSTQ